MQWENIQTYLKQSVEILRDPAVAAVATILALVVAWLTLRQTGGEKVNVSNVPFVANRMSGQNLKILLLRG
jgi:hypothetical protein